MLSAILFFIRLQVYIDYSCTVIFLGNVVLLTDVRFHTYWKRDSSLQFNIARYIFSEISQDVLKSGKFRMISFQTIFFFAHEPRFM